MRNYFLISLLAALIPSLAASEGTALPAATKCLQAPHCSRAELQAAYDAAPDTSLRRHDCMRLYYGHGVKRDLSRARKCFEAVVKAEGSCHGDSPDTARAILGVMYITGQGGHKKGEKHVEKLFADCFADLTVSGVTGLQNQLPEDKTAANVDFCSDIGGTTMTMRECADSDLDEISIETALAESSAKEVLAPQNAALVDQADKAWRQFANDEGEQVMKSFGPGTIGPQMAMSTETDMLKEFREWIERFAKKAALDPADPEKLKESDAKLNTTYQALISSAQDSEKQNGPDYSGYAEAIRKAQRSWLQARAGTIALFSSGVQDPKAKAKIADEVTLSMNNKRISELESSGNLES